MNENGISEIPTVSLATSKPRTELAKELVESLKTYGFIYLSDVGIENSVIEAGVEAAYDFFDRDVDFKTKFAQDVNSLRGYKAYETERFDPNSKIFDLREALLFDGHHMDRNVWPTEALKTTSTRLMTDMGSLSRRLLRLIGEGLGLSDPDIFNRAHSFHKGLDDAGSFTVFRVNHYPTVADGGMKEGQVQCGSHKDVTSITLLVQDDQPGLEIEVAEDKFVLAAPTPGSVVMFTGQMMETWTNGRLRACRHRVVKRMNKQRMSLIFFSQPDHGYEASPLPELLVDGETAKFGKMENGSIDPTVYFNLPEEDREKTVG